MAINQSVIVRLVREMKIYRFRHKLTQKQMAEKIGYQDGQSVHRLESGDRMPSEATAFRIAEVIGVSLPDSGTQATPAKIKEEI